LGGRGRQAEREWLRILRGPEVDQTNADKAYVTDNKTAGSYLMVHERVGRLRADRIAVPRYNCGPCSHRTMNIALFLHNSRLDMMNWEQTSFLLAVFRDSN